MHPRNNPRIPKELLDNMRPWQAAFVRPRLDTLTELEKIGLTALLKRYPPQAPEDIVNAVAALTALDTCYPAGSDAELGIYALRRGFATHGRSKPYLKMQVVGASFREQLGAGAFSGGAYVPHGSEPPGPAPQNQETLETRCPYVKAHVTSPASPEGVWVALPDYHLDPDVIVDEITAAFQTLEVEDWSDCQVDAAVCSLPGVAIGTDAFESQEELLHILNDLGYLLEERGQGRKDFMETYHAVLHWKKPTDLRQAVDLGANLHCFRFIPMEHGGGDALEQFGLSEALRNGILEPGSPEERMFDGGAYAADVLADAGKVAGGYILRVPGQSYTPLYQSVEESDAGLRMV